MRVWSWLGLSKQADRLKSVIYVTSWLLFASIWFSFVALVLFCYCWADTNACILCVSNFLTCSAILLIYCYIFIFYPTRSTIVPKCWAWIASIYIDFYMFFLSSTTLIIYFCIFTNYSGRVNDNDGTASDRNWT